MIVYRGVSLRFLSSYKKKKKQKKCPNQTQLPQHCQLMSLFQFYLIPLSIVYRLERRIQKLPKSSSQKPQEDQRLSWNLTRSSCRNLRVWPEVWCTLIKRISKTSKGFSDFNLYRSLRKQLWLKCDSSMVCGYDASRVWMVFTVNAVKISNSIIFRKLRWL